MAQIVNISVTVITRDHVTHCRVHVYVWKDL